MTSTEFRLIACTYLIIVTTISALRPSTHHRIASISVDKAGPEQAYVTGSDEIALSVTPSNNDSDDGRHSCTLRKHRSLG